MITIVLKDTNQPMKIQCDIWNEAIDHFEPSTAKIKDEITISEA